MIWFCEHLKSYVILTLDLFVATIGATCCRAPPASAEIFIFGIGKWRTAQEAGAA